MPKIKTATLAILTFPFLLSLAIPGRADEPQAMFRANPQHTGVYPGEGSTEFKAIKWKFKTARRIFSSPAIYAGTVYVGSDDGNLYAVDARDGTAKWQFHTNGAVNSSPAVTAQGVYFSSADGSFYALDPPTGKLLWKFETAGERQFEAKGIHGLVPRHQTIPDPWDFYLSSPVVANGLVYFGSGDNNFYALEASSGKLKWKFATRGVVHSSPAISEGTVYLGSWDSYFYALDAQTGQEKWKFKTGEDPLNFNQVGIQSSPAIADGAVYFGCRDSQLYALDARTGQRKWNFSNHGTWVISSPAVRDGVVYFGTSDPPFFRSLDTKTGAPGIVLPAGMFIFSSPAVAGQMAYFGSFNGKLHAVDLQTGKYKWEFQTESGKQDALGLIGADGKPNFPAIFVSNFWEDMVLAVNKLYTLGSILSSPVVENGVIYFGSTDGYLYALELQPTKP